MLILTRRIGETCVFGDNEVRVTILRIDGNQVRLGIEAPRDIPIHREEVFNRIKQQEMSDEITEIEDRN